MTNDEKIKFPSRSTYTVKTLLNDLKKLKLTPNAFYTVGTEIVYFEWKEAKEELGEEDEITIHLEELLNFMQTDYEHRLLSGELRREKDTPNEAINTFLRDTPAKFQSYMLKKPGQFIQGVLQAMHTLSEKELSRYMQTEKGIRKDLEKSPNNAELWNELRLVLWIQGKYDDASHAFRKAKKFGWDKSKSKTVGI